MTGLSLHSNGHGDAVVTLRPPLDLCACSGAASSGSTFLNFPHSHAFTDSDEKQLRHLFDHHIYASLSVVPSSPNLVSDSLRSGLFDELVQRFFSCRDGIPFPLCPALKRRIEALVRKLLLERMAGGGSSSDNGTIQAPPLESTGSLNQRKRKRGLVRLDGMLEWLRGLAVDPTNRTLDAPESRKQVLRARESFFLRLHEATMKRQLISSPFSKISGKGNCQFGGKVGSMEMLNQPRRRSERIAQHATQSMRHLLTCRRERIGIGPSFQANVPEWTGRPSERDVSDDKKDRNDLRWLGTQVWLVEGDYIEANKELIGKGKQIDCACYHPGTVACISSHVRAATLQLKADLGQAFYDWGFDKICEQANQSRLASEDVGPEEENGEKVKGKACEASNTISSPRVQKEKRKA